MKKKNTTRSIIAAVCCTSMLCMTGCQGQELSNAMGRLSSIKVSDLTENETDTPPEVHTHNYQEKTKLIIDSPAWTETIMKDVPFYTAVDHIATYDAVYHPAVFDTITHEAIYARVYYSDKTYTTKKHTATYETITHDAEYEYKWVEPVVETIEHKKGEVIKKGTVLVTGHTEPVYEKIKNPAKIKIVTLEEIGHYLDTETEPTQEVIQRDYYICSCDEAMFIDPEALREHQEDWSCREIYNHESDGKDHNGYTTSAYTEEVKGDLSGIETAWIVDRPAQDTSIEVAKAHTSYELKTKGKNITKTVEETYTNQYDWTEYKTTTEGYWEKVKTKDAYTEKILTKPAWTERIYEGTYKDMLMWEEWEETVLVSKGNLEIIETPAWTEYVETIEKRPYTIYHEEQSHEETYYQCSECGDIKTN